MTPGAQDEELVLKVNFARLEGNHNTFVKHILLEAAGLRAAKAEMPPGMALTRLATELSNLPHLGEKEGAEGQSFRENEIGPVGVGQEAGSGPQRAWGCFQFWVPY